MRDGTAGGVSGSDAGRYRREDTVPPAAPAGAAPAGRSDRRTETEDRRTTAVILVLALGGVLASLVTTLVVPLLPTLARHFDASTTEISWVVTASLLAGTVTTPMLGRFGDMFGKRRVLLAGQAVLAVGSLMCALAQSLGVLVAGRALQGVATSFIPLAIGVLRDELPPERVNHGIAFISASGGIGTAIGVPVGGLVVQRSGFHVVFWFAAAMSTVVFVAVWRMVRESPLRTPGRIDILGAVGLAAFLVCLLLPIAEGDRWGWKSAPTLGLFTLAALLLVGWLVTESRTRVPLVNLRVAVLRPVLLTNVTALLLGFVMFTNFLSTTQIVQLPTSTGYGFGLSLVGTGLCVLPGAICIMVLAPLSANLSDRFGPRFTLVLGCGTIATAFALRALLTSGLWEVVLGAALVSAGIGLAIASLPANLIAAVPQRMTAEANGVNTLTRMLGSTVSGAAVSAVLGALTISGSDQPRQSAFVTVFAIAAVASLLAAVTARAIPTGAVRLT